MLVLEAQLTRFSTMADGGGRIQLDTRELTPEEFSQVGSVNKKSGVMVFKPDVEKLSDEELEAIKAHEGTTGLGDKKKKSKSQVFRAVLYRLYEQEPEGFGTAQLHYEHYMDTIIDHFKKKLDKDGQ